MRESRKDKGVTRAFPPHGASFPVPGLQKILGIFLLLSKLPRYIVESKKKLYTEKLSSRSWFLKDHQLATADQHNFKQRSASLREARRSVCTFLLSSWMAFGDSWAIRSDSWKTAFFSTRAAVAYHYPTPHTQLRGVSATAEAVCRSTRAYH